MYTTDDLLYLMTRLREPVYGCPWDQVQSYRSIASSTIEEAYEVVDAIESGDAQQLREELGDLLFQVIFYSELAREEQTFDFADIVSDLTAKLIRRHPHVFPEGTLKSRIAAPLSASERASSEASIKASWEEIKANERQAKGYASILDDVPSSFPAITRALKLQKRASSVGFDWKTSQGVYDKLDEELGELKEAQLAGDKDAIEDEMGDMLFTLVNLSRHLTVDPETALRRSNRKFEQRFRMVETQASKEGNSIENLDAAALNLLWDAAKRKASAAID
ncbi:MAG: ATP diphosphatase [Candidatus Endobugula sp.]|jgi:ATP diphosphatase